MALLGIPQGAFVWGRGGQRVTPDQIAQQRDFAQQQRMAGMDFSPVGSVWEGVGRVASGFLGGQRMRRADAEASRNAEESQSVIAQLLAGPEEGSDPNAGVAAALSNPYIGDEARQIAMQRFATPEQPKDEVTRQAMIANDPNQPEWARQAAMDRLSVLNDPLSVITTSAGTQILPRSTFLGGRVAPQGPQPGSIEDGYRFRGGDPSSPESWEPVMNNEQGGQALGAAYSAQSISPDDAARVRQSLGPGGQSAFEDWLRANNITVGGI